MNGTEIKKALCDAFVVSDTSGSGFSIQTPMRYEDGDRVIVFIQAVEQHFRIDDNGEGALRLERAGVDMDHPKVLEWLSNLSFTHGIEWDNENEELYAEHRSGDIGDVVLRVAEASTQLQVLQAIKKERTTSNFKESVIEILKEASKEAGVEARFDVPAGDNQEFIVDAHFLTATPLAVIVATSVQRLLEAELYSVTCQIREDPTRVIAVVDEAKKIGMSKFTQATYHTHKTLEFSNKATLFRKLINRELQS